MEKSKIIENLFFNILTYSYLLFPLTFFFLGNRKKDIIPIILVIYGIVCFSFLKYHLEIPRANRKYFIIAYTFFEYSIFAFIFWKNYYSRKIKLSIIIISAAFLIFQVSYALSIKAQRLDSIPIGIETILLLLYIIYFFYQYSNKAETNYIYNHYLFWFSVGILIYLGGSFFFFILINHLSEDQIKTFGFFTYIAEIIKNIFFMVGIIMYAFIQRDRKGNHQKSIPYLDMV